MNQPWKWGSLVVVAAGVIAVCLMLRSKPPVSPALPVPNGYDDFVKAVGQVTTEGRAFRDVPDAELRNFVDQNREVLQSVRAACQRECRVPIVYNRSYPTAHSQILPGFKRLARAFWAEAVLAEREGRTNDAARIYIDGIRFAQETARGGRLIDRLQAVSCQALLLPSLTNLVHSLDLQSCPELARVLETIDNRCESREAVMHRERAWVQAVSGPKGQLLVLVHQITFWWESGIWSPRQFRNNINRIQSEERHLILDLACQAYQLEHGAAPSRPGDLVPAYIRAIPKDPVSGAEMPLVH